MEHAIAPVTHPCGDRLCVLDFNARAWRLILEKTGYDHLREQRIAGDALPVLDSDAERAAKYGAMIGERIKDLLTDTVKIPQVFWAICQNPANGSNGERPTLDYIEDYLHLDGAVITAISNALRVSFQRGIGGEPQGNAVAQPSLSTGSTSGPLPVTDSG